MAFAATACGASDGPPAAGSTVPGTSSPAATSSSSSAGTSPTSGSATTTTRPSSPGASHGSCAATTYAQLRPNQRVGQLVMVGLETSQPRAEVGRIISSEHVGNVFYLGGWHGSSTVADTSNQLQHQATSSATGGVGLLIAADQEGGDVQQLKGPGFSPLPSALQQGAMSSSALVGHATTIGRELKAAGVNVDLAPVAGTVPRSIGQANQPLGRWGREYGHTPQTVSPAVTDVVHGLTRGGVAATLKHFPGLGRVRANTDFSMTGITDDVMTTNDPYLRPFSAGIKAGADLVMMSLARYPKMDAASPAAFSSKIITQTLRGDLGFHGVVISDDLNAVAVRSTPVGQRAVRFIAAGGDIALTGGTLSAPTIVAAILARSAKDSAFALKVDRSVHRVLALKARIGLISCPAK
ncbi:glycoside hydrolase family 3 protein [Leekyejoonella antrihumi]|uniref:beta-N-acetylhexosaminidase n=2 Tax=Leekyejoonella antrihumi TaxID=1660198 RepID=A0A563E139_9MICO|nr:glycoside hydrolase family 3 protein [Leekyejoonella antrihumi]